MCGVCGILAPPGRPVSEEVLGRMTERLAHRGPDGQGLFRRGNVGLGHRRLSIIDLSPAADQPMANEDGTIWVSFNGEIYNHADLRRELEATGRHRWHTDHSDTEVLLHGYEEWGVDLLRRLRGMFAFALWDSRSETALLVRDRFGIKPMYYADHEGGLLFASEVRPLLAAGVPVEVNRQAVHLFVRSRFGHGDETIFKGVFRLPEGTYLRWTGGAYSLHRYYSNPRIETTDDGRDFDHLFEEALADAVRAEMVADVPVGAYLSGGVDSTVLVSEMARLTRLPVRTFCVDFREGPAEAALAARTARHFGCEHETLLCDVSNLLELPKVVEALEEPVGDAIVVAQYALARATRSAGVKAILTGDGADEVLGGYQFVRATIGALRWGGRIPGERSGSLLRALAERVPLGLVRLLADLPFDVADEARRRAALALDRAQRGQVRELFDLFVSLHCPEELEAVYTPEFFQEARSRPEDLFSGEPAGTTLSDRVLSLQYRKWLPANINLKQDRLSMAHSVENRVPYLDYRLVELLSTFPARTKIRGRRNKIVLRSLAARRLGRLSPGAQKVPFHLPLESYLRDARVWQMIDDHVEPGSIRRRGVLRPEYVERLRGAARGGDFMAAKKLLAFVILEMWFRAFVDSPPRLGPVARSGR